MHNQAREQDNAAIKRNTYLCDDSAKEFWEKHGYMQVGIHYRKLLRYRYISEFKSNT